MKRATKTLNELELHKALVRFLRTVLPSGALLMHSPNEGKRTSWEQAQLGAMGVVAGWPDLAIYWQGEATFMEVKTPQGKMSKAQENVRAQLREQGFRYMVVRSIDDVRTCLDCAQIPTKEKT